jgi:citrate lyase subunit beta / citryl-CoA lyase
MGNPIIKNDILSGKICKMPKPKNNGEIIKSSLMINPTNPKHLEKLSSIEAQVAVVNLEDGVADTKKEEALAQAMYALSSLEYSNALMCVRTNPVDSIFFKSEIEAINVVRPDAIRIPKIKTKDELYAIEEMLHPDIDVHLSIETKEAFHSICELKTSKRVTTLFLGAIDLLEDMGLGSSMIETKSETLKYMMCKFVVDSKSFGFTPVSFVWQNYLDMDGFESWLEIEKNMGFGAKACISPAQVRRANEFFSPDLKALEDAAYIKELYEKNESLGIGGFKDEKFGFIDAPIYKNAILTLKKGGVIL